ncbi:hypothetical protein [Coxiella burnetii]|nr:hypothetical protein [Coxiella burnetii]UYK70758.1 hypothetical protein OHM78_10715 [Coxiella burnetii]
MDKIRPCSVPNKQKNIVDYNGLRGFVRFELRVATEAKKRF